jgi:hypothetical protein
MDQQLLTLTIIGDLEVSRRQLVIELQVRDERIAELEQRLAEAERDE